MIVHMTNENKDLIDFELSQKKRKNGKNKRNLEKNALKAMKNKVLQYLTKEELLLVKYKFYFCLSNEAISKKLNISSQAVGKRYRKLEKDIEQIINKYLELYANEEMLTDKEKDIFELYFLYRLSYTEIAKKVGISRNLVSQTIKGITYKINS